MPCFPRNSDERAVFKSLGPPEKSWLVHRESLGSGVIFIKKSGGIVPELIMNQYFSQLYDGWETPFVAPNGSPLNGEYIRNMETPSSLLVPPNKRIVSPLFFKMKA